MPSFRWWVTDINLHRQTDPCTRVRIQAHQDDTDFEGWAATHVLDVLVPSSIRDVDEIAEAALAQVPALLESMMASWRPVVRGSAFSMPDRDDGTEGR
jgi:hypothetical protein